MNAVRDMLARHREVFGLSPRQQLYDGLLAVGWCLCLLLLVEAFAVVTP